MICCCPPFQTPAAPAFQFGRPELQERVVDLQGATKPGGHVQPCSGGSGGSGAGSRPTHLCGFTCLLRVARCSDRRSECISLGFVGHPAGAGTLSVSGASMAEQARTWRSSVRACGADDFHLGRILAVVRRRAVQARPWRLPACPVLAVLLAGRLQPACRSSACPHTTNHGSLLSSRNQPYNTLWCLLQRQLLHGRGHEGKCVYVQCRVRRARVGATAFRRHLRVCRVIDVPFKVQQDASTCLM